MDTGCPIHLELSRHFQLLKKRYLINSIQIFEETRSQFEYSIRILIAHLVLLSQKVLMHGEISQKVLMPGEQKEGQKL